MRNVIRLIAIGVTALLVGLLPSAAAAQPVVPPANATIVSAFSNAADVSPALYIKFVGTATSGLATTVQVATGAAITFIKNGAAYDGFECPVSGALGGIIDTSNAACNTLGEVVDTINGDVNRQFVAVIAGGLRSDSSASLLTQAATANVSRPEGLPVYWDTSSLDAENLLLVDYNKGIGNWVQPGATRPGPRPFGQSATVLQYGSSRFTNAGTAGVNTVYCVIEDYPGRTETVYTLYAEATAATTALGELNELTAVGGLYCQGGKLFNRVGWSGADTSAWFHLLYGYRVPLQVDGR